MKTKERILDVALELFNQKGTSVITTNHIAEAMHISPGNLYYHYRNKEEIVRALYVRLDQAFDALFKPSSQELGLADLERLLEANYELLWQYRFFYREIIALTQRDPQLKQHYETVRKRGYEGFAQLLQYFAQNGVLQPPQDPEAIQHLTDLCWMISEFWPPFLEAGGEPLTRKRLHDGVALIRQVLEPYML